MKIDPKYDAINTVHRTLPQNDDPANNIVSCGFLPWHRPSNVRKNICFSHYGGLYVLRGKGKYIDGITGKEYSVTPGCVVQRMPGVLHHFEVDAPSEWLEFYFCAGEKIFRTLSELKVVSDAPVFYVGEDLAIFQRLEEYHRLFQRTDDLHAVKLLLEFQNLLCWLNQYSGRAQKEDWVQRVCEVIAKNCQVGVPMEEIAVECGMSYETLRKRFQRVFDCSLSQYCINVRINQSKTMLLDENKSIQEVAALLGYCDTYAFIHQFKQQVGVSPGKFLSDWKEK